MWNEIINENDLNNFLSIFGSFHDSCIKEFKYISGAYVNEDLSMYPYNKERSLRVIFQRQYQNPSVIEMEFGGLLQMSLFLEDAHQYTCEIFDATMIFGENCIYWCDCGGLSEADLIDYKGTLLCAAKVMWREFDEYIGPDTVYKSDK